MCSENFSLFKCCTGSDENQTGKGEPIAVTHSPPSDTCSSQAQSFCTPVGWSSYPVTGVISSRGACIVPITTISPKTSNWGRIQFSLFHLNHQSIRISSLPLIRTGAPIRLVCKSVCMGLQESQLFSFASPHWQISQTIDPRMQSSGLWAS